MKEIAKNGLFQKAIEFTDGVKGEYTQKHKILVCCIGDELNEIDTNIIKNVAGNKYSTAIPDVNYVYKGKSYNNIKEALAKAGFKPPKQ